MTETSLRRKRLAEDEGPEDDRHSPGKRNRAGSGALKWLWSPSSPPGSPSPQSLWTFSDREKLFRGPDGEDDDDAADVPRSFSRPPAEPTYRRYRRRGAISVTSPAPSSELDHHLAMQLQQQIAVIRLKSATASADDDGELERVRRELEDVQLDAALPSVLGISLDFDRKLDLRHSGSPEGSENGGESCVREPPSARPRVILAESLFAKTLASTACAVNDASPTAIKQSPSNQSSDHANPA